MYGVQYLFDTAATKTSYCDVGSGSQLSCFHNNIGGRKDTFCLALTMILPPNSKTFELNWKVLKELGDSPVIEAFREDWYSTGLGYVFQHHIKINKDLTSKITDAET